MNKKGFFGNFVFGLVGLFVLILILVSLLAVQHGFSAENTIGILNNTEHQVLSQFTINESQNAVVKVIYSFLNFVVYSSMEVAKVGISYGVSHPEVVNPQVLLWIIIISLLIPVVYYLGAMLIVVIILIVDFFQARKEKRKLRQLEMRRGGESER